jgi:hypothetical protein
MLRDIPLLYDTESIMSWDGSTGYGYDAQPYTGNISTINNPQVIASQIWNININGEKNTYTYTIKIWALIDLNQASWEYTWTLDFNIDLNY